MHPRSVLFCYLLSVLVIDAVCNTRPSQLWQDSPTYYYLVGLPYICCLMCEDYDYDMISVLGSWQITNLCLYTIISDIFTLFILIFLLHLNQYFVSVSFALLLYLFTGLFKLSRIFFSPAAGILSQELGFAGDECMRVDLPQIILALDIYAIQTLFISVISVTSVGVSVEEFMYLQVWLTFLFGYLFLRLPHVCVMYVCSDMTPFVVILLPLLGWGVTEEAPFSIMCWLLIHHHHLHA